MYGFCLLYVLLYDIYDVICYCYLCYIWQCLHGCVILFTALIYMIIYKYCVCALHNIAQDYFKLDLKYVLIAIALSTPNLCVSSIGENIKLLIDRPDGTYCFRLHNERVYYMR